LERECTDEKFGHPCVLVPGFLKTSLRYQEWAYLAEKGLEIAKSYDLPMWPLAKCGFTLDLFTGIIEFLVYSAEMTAHTAEAFLPRWRLNRNSDVPLHVQIERLLRKLISSPPYSSGALLPDELTLASRLGVSRGTVRNSILKLVHQGLLERRKGVGTKVVQSGLIAWASLTGEMRRKGIDVQSFLSDVSEKPVEPAVAAALQVATAPSAQDHG